MSLKEKLLNIQQELKAPKNQYNDFGKYNYRSCEDILEAVKPLLQKHKVVMTLSDEVIEVGNRVYVRAAATLTDAEGEEHFTNTAWAREPQDKKGMDDSQITGTASSYARKYALNGLFLIDDAKDSDVTNDGSDDKITEVQLKSVRMSIEKNPGAMTEEGICKYFKIEKLEDMTILNLREFVELLNGKGKKDDKSAADKSPGTIR